MILLIHKTLPEAQRTQSIESITQIITHGKYHLGDEMIYMYDQKEPGLESKAWIIFEAKTKKNSVSALLAFVHSLVTTFPTLYTSLSSYSSTIISMTIITYPIAQQPILSPTWSHLQYSLQLLHHLADPLGDLIAHIGHLHTSLLLHHHLNDHHQLQIAILASSVSIDLVSLSARVTSAKSQPKLLYRQTPGPIDRTPETPGSGKNCDKSDKNMIKQRSKILKITSILVVTVFSSTKGDLLTPGNNKDGGDDNESHDFYKLQLMVNRTDRDTHH